MSTGPAVIRDGGGQAKLRLTPLLPRLSDAELAAHMAMVAELGAKAIWNDYLELEMAG